MFEVINLGTGIKVAVINQIKEYAENQAYEKALELIRQQDLSQSFNSQFVRICGEVFLHTKNYAECRNTLIMAHRIAPEANRILYDLIQLYVETGEQALVDQYYEQYQFNATEHDTDIPWLHYMVARGRREPAQRLYETLEPVHTQDRSDRVAYEFLRIFQLMGDTERFEEEYTYIMEGFRDSEYKKKAKHLKETKDAEAELYIYPAHSILEHDPAVDAEEARLLEQDHFRMHPKEPEIVLMADDYDAQEDQTLAFKLWNRKRREKAEQKAQAKAEKKAAKKSNKKQDIQEAGKAADTQHADAVSEPAFSRAEQQMPEKAMQAAPEASESRTEMQEIRTEAEMAEMQAPEIEPEAEAVPAATEMQATVTEMQTTVTEPEVAEAQTDTVWEPEVAEAHTDTMWEPEIADSETEEAQAETEMQATVTEPEVAEAQTDTVWEPEIAEAQTDTVWEPEIAETWTETEMQTMVTEPEVTEAQADTVWEPEIAEPQTDTVWEPEIVQTQTEPISQKDKHQQMLDEYDELMRREEARLAEQFEREAKLLKEAESLLASVQSGVDDWNSQEVNQLFEAFDMDYKDATKKSEHDKMAGSGLHEKLSELHTASDIELYHVEEKPEITESAVSESLQDEAAFETAFEPIEPAAKAYAAEPAMTVHATKQPVAEPEPVETPEDVQSGIQEPEIQGDVQSETVDIKASEAAKPRPHTDLREHTKSMLTLDARKKDILQQLKDKR